MSSRVYGCGKPCRRYGFGFTSSPSRYTARSAASSVPGSSPSSSPRNVAPAPARSLQVVILLLAQRLLHPAVDLLPIPPLNPNSSLASINARICSRLNRSPACTLMVNPQHAGSPLQAHLVWETSSLQAHLVWDKTAAGLFASADVSSLHSVLLRGSHAKLKLIVFLVLAHCAVRAERSRHDNGTSPTPAAR